MSENLTHYDNLNITKDAPGELVRAAYKILILLYHPDNFVGRENEAMEKAASIRNSYEVLIDPVSRAEYDAWLNRRTPDKTAFARIGHFVFAAYNNTANIGHNS